VLWSLDSLSKIPTETYRNFNVAWLLLCSGFGGLGLGLGLGLRLNTASLPGFVTTVTSYELFSFCLVYLVNMVTVYGGTWRDDAIRGLKCHRSRLTSFSNKVSNEYFFRSDYLPPN
jgi:hypothetical protein